MICLVAEKIEGGLVLELIMMILIIVETEIMMIIIKRAPIAVEVFVCGATKRVLRKNNSIKCHNLLSR